MSILLDDMVGVRHTKMPSRILEFHKELKSSKLLGRGMRRESEEGYSAQLGG